MLNLFGRCQFKRIVSSRLARAIESGSHDGDRKSKIYQATIK
jgi:hypothetical protein